MDLKDKNIYLCGRIDGRPIDEARAEFTCIQNQLWSMGAYRVFNPVSVTYDKPHNDAMFDRLSNLTESWLRLDKDCFEHYEHSYNMLVTLPGWQSSEDACLEVAVAKACGIQVIEYEDMMFDENV